MNVNIKAPLTASRGYASVRVPPETPTVYRPAALYAKVATNKLSTTWFGRSRRKLRSSRGENCVDDSCSATTVRPRVKAITVTTVPLIAINKPRASSAVPWKTSGESGPRSICDMSDPTSRASKPANVGSTHSDADAYSRSASRLITVASSGCDHCDNQGRCETSMRSRCGLSGPGDPGEDHRVIGDDRVPPAVQVVVDAHDVVDE